MTQLVAAPTTVAVEIYGATYHLRADEEAGHLEAVAQLVDNTMKQVAAQVPTVDATKIAVLAALNLADELVRAQDGSDTERDGSQVFFSKLAELTEEIEQAISA